MATLAVIPVAPAYAEPAPEVCTVEGPNNTMVCKPLTPPAPSTSSGDGGLGDWVSGHAGLIVLVVAGLLIWAVIAGLHNQEAEEKTRRDSRDATALDLGRNLAEAWYAGEVAKAHAEAAAKVPPREVYDPAGVGLAPPPPPPVVMPDPPATADDDLRRYATFGAYTPWTAGTAFAQAVTRSGDDSPIRSAWSQACQLAGLGETNPETGEFTPAATVAWIAAAGDGDVEISVDPRDYAVGDQQLNRTLRHLERTARVATASSFVRNPVQDWFMTRLSMQAAPQPAPASTKPIPDDPWS